MYFDATYYLGLFNKISGKIQLPSDYFLVLEGSIAEGFGNSTSDVDYLIVTSGESVFQTMPDILFEDGKRIEIRYRTESEVKSCFEELKSSYDGGRVEIKDIVETDIDHKGQRFLNAKPLFNAMAYENLLSKLAATYYPNLVSEWFSIKASLALEMSATRAITDSPFLMASWARTVAFHAVKSWLALKGETYVSPKWIFEQLIRIQAPDEITEELRYFDRLAGASTQEEFLDSEFEKLQRFCTLCISDINYTDITDITLVRNRDVTTWSLDGTLHICVNKTQTYIVSEEGKQFWTSLQFKQPLAESLLGNRKAKVFVKSAIEAGLVHVYNSRLERSVDVHKINPESTDARISFRGAFTTDQENDICLLPFSPPIIAQSGVSMFWSNMMIENAIEDSHGAINDEQWGNVENSLRRILRLSSKIVYLHLGMASPPLEEVTSSLSKLSQIPLGLVETIIKMEKGISVEGRESAIDCFDAVNQILENTRAVTHNSLFPSSFENMAGWQETYKIGYDWARFGAYFGVEFPIKELQDVLGD